jgi:hypothetical protein
MMALAVNLKQPWSQNPLPNLNLLKRNLPPLKSLKPLSRKT